MKLQFALALATLWWLQTEAEEKYTTKYDNVSFDEIIASDRLLKNYLNCLLDQGRCTPDAKELKRVLPDALETDCQKCSQAQKTGIGKVVKYLIANRREWWNELETRYDPDGKYVKKYKEELEKEGITLR
ncbi:unnamed protein product [Ceutorhynchus assimilis]|uniref:Chemosensory protein n=1 Tax=Ceutorhynchus assimilis TaxID=467358 RepID=A0A9P0DVF9_9CUCU|nr:unnamed protein product [Ceutorhynchus assimilis]